MAAEKLVGSVNKTLAILSAFTRDKMERGVSELSRELGLHKATVHHILKDLERWSFVQQDEKTQKYRLGMRLLELGDLVRGDSDLKNPSGTAPLPQGNTDKRTRYLVMGSVIINKTQPLWRSGESPCTLKKVVRSGC